MRNPSLDQLEEQNLALTVPCPYCGSAPQDPCTTKLIDGTVRVIENMPAHTVRTKRAERAQRLAAADAERWEQIPVADFAPSEHRGRIVQFDTANGRFVGISTDETLGGEPLVVVHGITAEGMNVQRAIPADGTVPVLRQDR